MSGPVEMIALAATVVALNVAGLAWGRRRWALLPWRYWRNSALVNIGLALVDLAGGERWGAAGEVIAVLIAAFLSWLNRRNRKDRARKQFGAKSRALRDALVRKARELSVPRPVLAPGGAR